VQAPSSDLLEHYSARVATANTSFHVLTSHKVQAVSAAEGIALAAIRWGHPNSMLFRSLRPSLLQSLPAHLSCLFRRKSPLGPFFYHDPGSYLLIRDFLIAMGASHPCTQAKFVSDASMLADHRLHSLRQTCALSSKVMRGHASCPCPLAVGPALPEVSAARFDAPKRTETNPDADR
jgi:hypothetical protein